jgi:hypothetical protein
MPDPGRRRKLWRWLLLLYLAGIVLDIGWHVWRDLVTGDRQLELHEWLFGVQASLFWPLDILAQAVLALR